MLSRRLIDWYEASKRDLPWRRTRDPYAIWISETMLQQTLVATVIPYWERWLADFPTPTALADAPLDDVLKHWQGLGYYARARNLHKAAQKIRDEHGGIFPQTYDEVLALPGIGPYTAGAVCSIALGLDTPIVDANVIRVLTRLFAIPGDPKSTTVQEALWKKATELIPPGEARAFNQGMMELGALICGFPPQCSKCPLTDLCEAYLHGETDRFPELAPKKALEQQRDVCAALFDPQGRVLMIQRPIEGVWGGLWELPRVTATEGESDSDAAERAAREVAGIDVRAGAELARLKHGIMNKKVTLLALDCEMESEIPAGLNWFSLEEAHALPLPSPQAKLLDKLARSEAQLALF
ncbi:MAG: A/G-specific adenine glycosylase [Armatimonas sp.]